jgi:hypothetical protein
VEVVAWLSSRKDLVATAFALVCMTCYLRYRSCDMRSGQSRDEGAPHPGPLPIRWGEGGWGKAWYAASLLSFLLASSGKQSVILLPLVMLAWDALVEGRRDWRMLADKIPFGLVTVCFGWMTWNAQPSTGQATSAYVLAVTQLTNLWLLTGLGTYVLYRPSPDPAAASALVKALAIGGAALIWAVLVWWVWRSRVVQTGKSALQLAAAFLCCWVLINMLPPMALSFMSPITDRYLFLPSVGVCLLVAYAAPFILDSLCSSSSFKVQSVPAALVWLALSALALVWAGKTRSAVAEWRDPRSVWYFVAAKSKSVEGYQYSGEVYHEAADRVQEFIRSGKAGSLTNDLPLAAAVLGDGDSGRVEALAAEWKGARDGRTNSVAYRDRLWALAWERYEQAVAHRGRLNTPNLFMRRGMILVSQGKPEAAIKEFEAGLELAQKHTYERVRRENVTHLQRALGVAYWGQGRYSEARDWLLKAQATQRQSGQVWIPTLDQEVQRITNLAPPKP